MKLYLTNTSRINSIEVVSGNMIFCQDARTIYLDGPNGRKAYEQIMCLADDAQRIAMTNTLVTGFYFVKSNNVLWRLEDHTWIKLTNEPEEKIVYGTLESFPIPGMVGTLYMTDENLYHWDSVNNRYDSYCKSSPQWEDE